MERTLAAKQRVLVGLTLFSMFFGAGNLIFPSYVGAAAGDAAPIAMAGFALSAVGFPVLGVVAVAKSGGLDRLAGRVHPRFALVFTLLIYLSIGPCLAIPRTASTSFEMAVLPFAGAVSDQMLPLGISTGQAMQAAYSAAFFAIAGLIALKPDKLTQRLGKVLGPSLLALIAVLLVGCLAQSFGGARAAEGPYASLPFTTGFLEGYQTMDAIAALNFGLVIVLNIRAFGVEREGSVVNETVRAGLMAGAVLVVVYCALAYVGACAGGLGATFSNGANVLTAVASGLFGSAGSALMAALFFIACLNTCVGLLSCCSEYFSELIPRVRYRGWVAIFAAASMLVSNLGLDAILALSVPVLNALYPVAIVLILLGLGHRFFDRHSAAYPVAVACTAVVSVVSALVQAVPFWTDAAVVVSWLPFYDVGLGWAVPAAVGTALGVAASAVRARRYEQKR